MSGIALWSMAPAVTRERDLRGHTRAQIPVANLDFGGKTWNNGWFAGAGIEYMAYQTALADIILGVEYQHFDVGLKQAFVCDFAHCGPTHHQDFLQGARGDIVRARLAFKSRGLGY